MPHAQKPKIEAANLKLPLSHPFATPADVKADCRTCRPTMDIGIVTDMSRFLSIIIQLLIL